jgi:poly-gamma-glutamate synthesis protein (capsule biosynthesis protein)
MELRGRTMIVLGAAASVAIVLALYVFSPNTTDRNVEVFQENVTMVAVGDSIGYNVDVSNLSDLKKQFGDIDIFIFNLEGVLADPEKVSCEGFPKVQSIFTSDLSFARSMKLARITIANMANNHVFDCGDEGIRITKEALQSENILAVGAGQDLEEACQPLVVDLRGRTIVFVSYNFVLEKEVSAGAENAGAASLDRCMHDYDAIKSNGADIIIASIHLGYWSARASIEQKRVVEGLFASGVDMVIGHSPHMPQAVFADEDGKIAFFSLGNFVFRPDYEMKPLAYTTIVPRIELSDDHIDVTIYPFTIDRQGVPHDESEGKDGEAIISRIVNDSKSFGTAIDIAGKIGHMSVSR